MKPTLKPAASETSQETQHAVTIGIAKAALERAFKAAGIADGRKDARILIAHACGLTSAQIVAHPEYPLEPAVQETLIEFQRRRLRHEPVSRILSEREFWGHAFEISADVLDPRADSETVIETVLSILAEEDRTNAPLRLLDIGTGSGCLLLSLLRELPLATGVGSDISHAALQVAKRNAVRLEVSARVDFVCGDALDAIAGPFDLVISNPPYIRSGDIPHLMADVRRYDPDCALNGGSDGLNIYRRITSGLIDVVPDGWVVLETGAGQSNDIADMLVKAGFIACAQDASVYRDLAGHDRCVAAKARNRA